MHCGGGNRHFVLQLGRVLHGWIQAQYTAGLGAMCNAQNTYLMVLNQRCGVATMVETYVLRSAPVYNHQGKGRIPSNVQRAAPLNGTKC